MRWIGQRFSPGFWRGAALVVIALAGGWHGLAAAQEPGADGVRFAIIGDYGVEGEDVQAVAEMIEGWGPEFIITTGDNNYEKGAAATIDANIGQYFHAYIAPYTGSYGQGAAENRFFPVLGNHDYQTADGQAYLDYFTLPGNERYYQFTWGPVEFFAVDSNPEQPDGIEASSAQAEWLRAGLAASTAPWQIVYFHHAPYSSGSYGPNETMQWPFGAWGADAVIFGHEHLYERFDIDGTPYITNGLGGSSRRHFESLQPGSVTRFRDGYGALRASASPAALRLEFWTVNEGGTLIDWIELHADGTRAAMPQPVVALPTAETAALPHEGDSATDAAIWVNPADPAQSVVIGSDKQGGLAVYDLAGQELQYAPDGEMWDVDLRPDFVLGGHTVTLVAAANDSATALALYTFDPVTRQLVGAAAQPIQLGVKDGYGLCLYHSAATGEFYAVAIDKHGHVEQWRLFDDGQGKIDAEVVRTFKVGSHAQGCVADDERGDLYIAEEDVALWRYGAEPQRGEDRAQVDVVGDATRLLPDIEGLALYLGPGGSGYLIASSQGRSAFAVYERGAPNAYVGSFAVEHGPTVDGVSGTEGIAVTSAPLGDAFPHGLFVAQDVRNDDRQRNFKLVPWDAIAEALGLPVGGTG